jgi:hypothetical protein
LVASSTSWARGDLGLVLVDERFPAMWKVRARARRPGLGLFGGLAFAGNSVARGAAFPARRALVS